MEEVGSHWTDFNWIWCLIFFVLNLSRNFRFYSNPTRITGTSHLRLWLPRWILFRTRNFANKSCRENQNAHFVFGFGFFPPENRTLYEIMSKNVVEPERPQMTIWRHVACWISEAIRPQAHARAHTPTLTHARTQKYVIFIAFPQQWFRERVTMFRYTYIACLSVCLSVVQLQSENCNLKRMVSNTERNKCSIFFQNTSVHSCTGPCSCEHFLLCFVIRPNDDYMYISRNM